jgi:hypothetical protein
MLIASFTFGDALLTTLEFALLFLWIWIAVDVVFDIFRSRDLSNAAKALWILFIVVLPLFGVVAYLVVRGHTMHEHEVADRSHYAAFRRFTAGMAPGGPAGDIAALADLRDRGVLTDEEFERAKAKVLA